MKPVAVGSRQQALLLELTFALVTLTWKSTILGQGFDNLASLACPMSPAHCPEWSPCQQHGVVLCAEAVEHASHGWRHWHWGQDTKRGLFSTESYFVPE